MAQPNPPTPLPPTFSFPSPGVAPTHQQAFNDAVAHAKKMMSSYDAAILRQAVRELWESTLVGSEYHSSFLVSSWMARAGHALGMEYTDGWNNSAAPCFTEPPRRP